MPRPERPIDADNAALMRFAVQLRQLRESAGSPTYRELARRAHYSASTLSGAAAGRSLPSLDVTVAYVRACGADPAEWEQRWHRVATELVPPDASHQSDTGVAPYLGLSTFGTQDAQRFFGRERLVDDLLAKLERQRFLVVFGPSGSGKSSLLRAGLLPAITDSRSDGRRPGPTLLFTPGEHPIEECAVQVARLLGVPPSSLRADLATDPHALHLATRQVLVDQPEDTEVLLVVDQFEELFTMCHDISQREQFIAALLAATHATTSRTRVVLGVRADFYGRCAEHPALVEALHDSQILVGSMTPAELRAAITQPAAQAGLSVEATLVSTIITEMIGRPGALPLMSHALLETWRRRKGTTLTLAAYHATGGIDGALTRTAERTYATLTPEQRLAARDILLRLTALGEGADDTRRRVHRRELDLTLTIDTPTIDVVHRLAQARLLTLGQDTIEIAHEALIRSWPRLRSWLTEDRDGLCIHRQLTDATDTWETLDHDPGALYRGTRLAIAQEWFQHHPTALTERERTFLHASGDAHTTERRRTRRRNRQLRWLAAGLTLLLVLAVAGAAIAVQQRHAALVQSQISTSRELAAQANATAVTDTAHAIRNSLDAYSTYPTIEARSSLLNLASRPAYHGRIPVRHPGSGRLAAQPNGNLIASLDTPGVTVWDSRTRLRVAVLPQRTGDAVAVMFSPDGSQLAAADWGGAVTLWSVDTRTTIAELRTHDPHTWAVAFSADGRSLATLSEKGAVELWDTATSQQTARFATGGPLGRALAFSPHNPILATASSSGQIAVWNPNTQAHLADLDTGNPVLDLAFSPAGDVLAVAEEDGTVELWDAARWARIATLTGHAGAVEAVAFNREGTILASAGTDNTILLWRVDLPARLLEFTTDEPSGLHSLAFTPQGTLAAAGMQAILFWDTDRLPYTASITGPNTAEFSPEGSNVISANERGDLTTWDTTRPQLPIRQQQLGDIHRYSSYLPPSTVAFSPDHTMLVVPFDDGVGLWEATSGRHVRDVSTASGSGLAKTVVFSPNGQLLGVADGGRTMQVLLLGQQPDVHYTVLVQDYNTVATAFAFTPDNRQLIIGTPNGWVIFMDVATSAQTAKLQVGTERVTGFAASPDGRRLVVGTAGGSVTFWDLDTGTTSTQQHAHNGEVRHLAFSPDGRLVATGGSDKNTILWDPTTHDRWAVLTSRVGRITDVTWRPDGKILLISSEDGTITPWHINVEQATYDLCHTLANGFPAEIPPPIACATS
jgi:WD40 repeat protein/transcriptional regulator with XRE-family HTH domain